MAVSRSESAGSSGLARERRKRVRPDPVAYISSNLGIMSFRVIPVIDLMNGQVVHGIAGERLNYLPIQSLLTHSCQPLEVARAFREHFGLTEIYLADLDAIAGGVPSYSLYLQLKQAGFRVWVDAGVQSLDQVGTLQKADVDTVILALETVAGPQVLVEACQCNADRIVFSLDLKGGKPLGNLADWPSDNPLSIARTAIQAGIKRILLLDLSHVGMNKGVGCLELARELLQRFPVMEVTIGGGVRNATDLVTLKEIGVSAALVATALHKRAIRREQI
jgi:phosphoribosylformimino-5-aminoimidazole carboxamide ribotide isomerase